MRLTWIAHLPALPGQGRSDARTGAPRSLSVVGPRKTAVPRPQSSGGCPDHATLNSDSYGVGERDFYSFNKQLKHKKCV